MENIKSILQNADAVLIGAGAGLSTSAGFTYSGPRFQKYFFDFEKKYGFHDMYSGGFTDFESLEENWAYWSRQIFVNRYANSPKTVYEKLLELVGNKNYFVLTTNVDHAFQKGVLIRKNFFTPREITDCGSAVNLVTKRLTTMNSLSKKCLRNRDLLLQKTKILNFLKMDLME